MRCVTRWTLSVLLTLSATTLSLRAEDHAADELQFFESRIRPVLIESCYACHSTESGESNGGLLLDSRHGLLTGGDSGPAVVPGNAEASLLLKAIRYKSPDLQMPPQDEGGPLPAEVVADFQHWIASGAADSRDALKLPPARDMNAAKQHWAFRPLHKPAIPQLDVSLGARRPLDHFVFSKQADLGLSHNPEADRRTLLRRLTYDLTGLPPTYDDVVAFEQDDAPDAYERVVNRLLDSPTYGQRWGRFWLDVARYADTKGYLFGGQQQRFAFSHTYRDYVIDAFNADKPFEQFIVEQVAADQLELGDDKSPLAALGYLTLGRRFLNNQDDIIDDRIDVVMRGMLGLTVTCARCHDHKFDPIPTADYYSLHGVFASSEEPGEQPLLGETPDSALYRDFLEARRAIENKIEARKNELIDAFLTRERSQTGNYLLGARLSQSLPHGDDLDLFAGERKLNPHLLRRWIAYLNSDAAASSELFTDWITSDDPQASANAYNTVFKDAVEHARDDNAAVRAFVASADSPANPPRDEVARWIRREINERSAGLKQELEALNWKHDGAPLRAMALVDVAQPHDSRILLRGKRGNNDPEVPRRFLEALSPHDRQPFQHGSGRLELARAIAAQPLAARVFVNRVWGWHFGKPLVDTPSDFGLRTQAPVLVDALEWLTAEFLENGGSIKQLHRQIVLSATYRQSSAEIENAMAVDAENETLYRCNRRRLDFEAMRDTLLAVTGSLDRSLGGLPVTLTTTPFATRRTVYGYIDRQNLPGVFRTFDFPNPDATNPQRFRTTVPQQALFMMNSPFVIEQADRLAEQIGNQPPAEAVVHLYQLVFQRLPDEDERLLGIRFLTDADTRKRSRYCQSLMLTNELMFVD